MKRFGSSVFLAGGLFALTVLPVRLGFAQNVVRAPLQQWWAYKAAGGVYVFPNRPLWKLTDLKQKHAGQSNWQELIVSNPEQLATYNSAAPGTKFAARMNTDTKAVFAVVAGEIRFSVEGQASFTATHGSVVNVMESTVHSWEVVGAENALWVEVHPADTKTVYPADGPAPPPLSGTQVVKVGLNHVPGANSASNPLHWNFFDAVAACAPLGVRINEDHQIVSARAAFANANDPEDKCKGHGGPPTIVAAKSGPFDPNAPFGHMHDGKMEWWLVLSGHIDAKLEAIGELHADEGDVLSAPASTWHDIGFEGPGLSAMLAFTPYIFNNLANTAGDGN